MRLILIVFLLSTSMLSFSQTQEQKDSLVSEICNVLAATADRPDSLRVQIAYEKHLYPFMGKFTEEQRNEIGMAIYFRLQRNCSLFQDILSREKPPAGDWEVIGPKPSTRLPDKVCRSFLHHKEYFYRESTGDTVRLRIENGYWTDHFKDGTHSKLRLVWVGDCQFDIEFIESNNDIRRNFSKPGDRYRYQIIDKAAGYYDMSVEIVGTDRHLAFKIYY